jgi:hypothetical protein
VTGWRRRLLEGVEPSGSLRKVSGYISILLSRTSPVATVVYTKRPFGGPQQVLDYLDRYTHRVAIASRLVGLTEGRVSFRWKDYRHHDKQKVMTLGADEFIRRFLLAGPGGNVPAIMPERLAAESPFKPVAEIVGSGPFRYLKDEHVSGARVVFERFAEYRPRARLRGRPGLAASPRGPRWRISTGSSG